MDMSRAERQFRENMRLRRRVLGVSQRELSERLADIGVTLDPSAITRIENGQRVIRLGEALMIADMLNFPIQPAPPNDSLMADRLRIASQQLLDLAELLSSHAEERN